MRRYYPRDSCVCRLIRSIDRVRQSGESALALGPDGRCCGNHCTIGGVLWGCCGVCSRGGNVLSIGEGLARSLGDGEDAGVRFWCPGCLGVDGKTNRGSLIGAKDVEK